MKLKIAACVAALAMGSSIAWAQGLPPRLERADANHDGILTRAEMNTQREAMFDRADANGDGYISEDERPERRPHRRPDRAPRDAQAAPDGAPSPGPGQHGARGARADADGDGRISRAEFMGQPMRGFDRFDANDDDRLDAQEIETMRNTMQHRRRG